MYFVSYNFTLEIDMYIKCIKIQCGSVNFRYCSWTKKGMSFFTTSLTPLMIWEEIGNKMCKLNKMIWNTCMKNVTTEAIKILLTYLSHGRYKMQTMHGLMQRPWLKHLKISGQFQVVNSQRAKSIHFLHQK